ncbi:unnamed protein product [Chrysodeixis includens]|uniref:BTB domain-containing protein n=1 Tax=Chrysodeixis includens TaxID=689277 RepID=A0A9N8KWK8_CHRIL|nr:unnamed protein product [Chrysodeixis includens]
MTLAADGHQVKVHQLVMSMASPYIRSLITSASCPHPVIFLNNISYSTLRAILEYIYSGEVLVDRDKLSDVIAAGKALHIRGLRGMKEPNTPQAEDPNNLRAMSPLTKNVAEKLRQSIEKNKAIKMQEDSYKAQPKKETNVNGNYSNKTLTVNVKPTADTMNINSGNMPENSSTVPTPEPYLHQQLQYSISSQGGLQAIHQRHIYRLKYFGHKCSLRVWQCIDFSSDLQCPATLTTNQNNEVTFWSYAHNHPNHEKRIMQKLRSGKVYTEFFEAETCTQSTPQQRFLSSILANNTCCH